MLLNSEQANFEPHLVGERLNSQSPVRTTIWVCAYSSTQKHSSQGRLSGDWSIRWESQGTWAPASSCLKAGRMS